MIAIDIDPRLFGENASERARRLWSEDKKGQGT